ncbi:hypothetical protein B0H15DRAFT_951695 [Mycena belliarum]|uniref:Uncharacterized protein n=1 Tax=Mycena belliarum TaxID=1033014 RepID=A0AAD6XJY2_9AGAR|nr:hypothetical protein B0H15DRAFT_951695 [Mycena belliae]
MEWRIATNVFPTPPTTISLSSKAMKLAACMTFAPAKLYIRYDRGAGACLGQSKASPNQSEDAECIFLLAARRKGNPSHVTIGANQAESVHSVRAASMTRTH